MLLGGAVAPPWGCCSTLQTVCWNLVRVSRMKVSHNVDIVSPFSDSGIICIPAAT